MSAGTEFAAASRDALSSTRRRLQEITEQSSAGDLATLSEQLEAVADLLGRETDLRRTLADTSAEGTQRESLASRILDDKVARPAADVIRAAVSSPWSRAEDLPEGLRFAAREALLLSADRDERLDAVEDELFRLGRIVGSQQELDRLLSDPRGDAEGKQRVIERLLSGRSESVTHRLAALVVAESTARSASDRFERLAGLAAELRARSVATVRSAVALSPAQQERLAGVLARIYRREITIHLEVDPELIGGLVIQVGDEVIDGTAAGRLDELGRSLG